MEKLNVKAGDKVIVHYGGAFRDASIEVVEKITPKGFIKVQGTLYYDYGTERSGGAWNKKHIEELTPEKEKKITEVNTIHRAIHKMHNTTRLTYEQATKILEILVEK